MCEWCMYTVCMYGEDACITCIKHTRPCTSKGQHGAQSALRWGVGVEGGGGVSTWLHAYF